MQTCAGVQRGRAGTDRCRHERGRVRRGTPNMGVKREAQCFYTTQIKYEAAGLGPAPLPQPWGSLVRSQAAFGTDSQGQWGQASMFAG